MRSKNVVELLANFTIIVVGLLIIGSAAVLGLEQVVGAIDSGSGPGVHVAEADLYVKPQPKPDHPLKKEFPELFATEAIVVTFGADWCAACRRQAFELRGPSNRYNIIKAPVEKDGEKTRWSKLMDTLKLGETIPVTVVVSKGKVTKAFYGFTPWAEIKPHAGKAKKNEKDETDHIDIGPIHIDWDDGVDIDIRRRKPRP